MSAIHRALTDTDQRDSEARSEFNPLQRATVRSQRAWWWFSLVLILAIVMVTSHRLWFGTPTEVPVQIATFNPISADAAPQQAIQPAAPESTADATVSPEATEGLAQADTTLADADPLVVETASPVLTQSEQPPAPRDQRAASLQEEARPAPIEPEPEPEASPEPEIATEPVSAEQPVRTASTEPVPARPEAAAAPAQPVRDIVTPSTPTHESRVQAAIANQDLPSARQWLQQWISEEPVNEVPRVWLARIYLAEDQLPQARSVLQGQRSIEARALIGLVHERSGEFQQAAALYETLAREDPGNEQWWLRWAINLENSGQLAQARNLYQTYLQVFPGQDSSLTRFAQQRYQSLEGQP